MAPPRAAATKKVIFVGNLGVGKSCLVARMTSDNFDENGTVTVGCDFKIKDLDYQGQRVRLLLWDTAGQERFQAALSANYYRGADAVVFVYDVTQRDTFEALRSNWMAQFQEHCTKPGAAKLIVANKIDLATQREVTEQQGAQLAQEAGCLYAEASAKTEEGVYDTFLRGLVHTMLAGGNGHEAGVVVKGDGGAGELSLQLQRVPHGHPGDWHLGGCSLG